jgi:acyl-CoA synthetase (NDP forming)
MLDVAATTEAPLAVLASVGSAIDPPTANRLRDNGIPVLENARSGIAALGHLACWPRPLTPSAVPVDDERRQLWSARLAQPDWDAPAAFELLADYGIPVARSRTAHDLTEVLTAADDVGYPVALKTLGAAHKSDVGGVVLGIADGAALQQAYLRMAEELGPDVSIDAMAAPGVEISVGVVRDDNFGPLVIVAAGGTLVELLSDRAVACPPVTRQNAIDMLRSLRTAPLLAGWRGAQPVDLEALADVVVGFSSLATELGERLDAVEANPVIASPGGAVAVDALVVPRSAPSAAPE